ncbi:hypothetical protein ZWY2020_022655 [Hordeum vulgare]|nr:hypothetical protein ZWY2020_022655 [Hordeum vulgare]
MHRQRRPPPGSRAPTNFFFLRTPARLPLTGSSCRCRRSPEDGGRREGRLLLLLLHPCPRSCRRSPEAGEAMDPGAGDEDPGLWDLFRHYDELYFRCALADAAFSVEWVSPRTKAITCFGSCSFGDLHRITLYKPALQYRTNADTKNALLHLMIHAIIFLKHGLTSLGHGPVFRDWMDAINTCPCEDHARPTGGYCITTTHDFSQEKSCNIQGFLWKCESCGHTLVRAKKLKHPSDSCCIENVSQHPTCGNMLCHWHNHKMDCGGTYVLTKPPVTPQKMALKGGSSSSKKASNSNMPEDLQKAIVLSAAPPRRLTTKQELIAWAKREQLLTGSRGDATKSLGSSSPKKADASRKAIVLSAAPRTRGLKRKKTSGTSEERGFFSPGSCSNANPPRSDTSGKDPQRSGVRPCASQKKLKLVQDLVALEKHISRAAATGRTLKQPTKSGSSAKARRQHQQPEDCPKTAAQPAVPRTRSEPKQSSRAAPERRAARSKAGGSAERKEYVCFSLWQNFYESECSSGSAEPLVNKRTLRRKRQRERLVQRARSSSIKVRPDELASSGQTKPPSPDLEVIAVDVEVMAEAPAGQSRPPAPSIDVLVDQVVTQAPGAGGQSQRPAPSMDVLVGQVVTQAPGAGGQSQPPAPSMDVVTPLADRSDPSSSMDVAAAVAPAGQVMTQTPADQSQPPPAPCSIAAGQVILIDISDDDDDDD